MIALASLRADALRLPPGAAVIAMIYVGLHLELPDVWRSALLRTLYQVAGDTPRMHARTLMDTIGKPGAWLPAAYHGDASEARLWLAAVEAMAAAYAPTPSAAP